MFFDIQEKKEALQRKKTLKKSITLRRVQVLENAFYGEESDFDSVDLSGEEDQLGDQR